MKDQSEFLKVALEAVKAAEAIILKYHNEGFMTEMKADATPVTVADREAEEKIKLIIRQKFPDHTFYGEEGEKTNLDNHHGYAWIIDPIDGTKNFVRRSYIFGTLLALMHDGELVLGVSNIPMLHELMYAEKGRGAFFNGQPAHVSSVANVSETYLNHGSLKYFVRTGVEQPLLKLSQVAHQIRGIGDIWAYHLLAQGKIDVMMEAQCKLWDVAAAKVIIEEAGGTFTQLDGQPVSSQTTSALATNSLLHKPTLAFFTEA